MKTIGKGMKRLLSVLLCCVLLLLPLGLTAGAVQEEGPEYQEDHSRAAYFELDRYGFKRVGTSNNVNIYMYGEGESSLVTNIKVWVEIQSDQNGQWGFYMNEDDDPGLMGSGNPLKYDYTRYFPDGYYKAYFTVRTYKLLIYQTVHYTATPVLIY